MRLGVVVALMGMVAVSPAAIGQGGSARERSSILVGAFVTDRDSSTRVDSEAGLGTDLSLEDDLGLESSLSVARVGGYYWFTPRHRLDASYFDLSRSATKPIEETIQFSGRTFGVDSVVESEDQLAILKADYTFAALARERGFLGVTAGLYVMQTKLSLRDSRVGAAESEDLTAPLPVIGVRGDYFIGERFTLRGAAQWFGLETDDVDGTLRDFYIGADYGFGDRMAVGLAYNQVSMRIRAQDEDGLRGRLDWGYDGLLLYFKVAFGQKDAVSSRLGP